jgi:hypothetical protein
MDKSSQSQIVWYDNRIKTILDSKSIDAASLLFDEYRRITGEKSRDQFVAALIGRVLLGDCATYRNRRRSA